MKIYSSKKLPSLFFHRNRGWDDHVVGMAYVNGMCTGNSAAVDKVGLTVGTLNSQLH